MTKKEQAIKAVHLYIGESVFGPGEWPSDFDDKLRSLVHAIDEAEREERGVVDVQEIIRCQDCCYCMLLDHVGGPIKVRCTKSFRDITHETIVPPDWCPRRKENRL